MNGQAPSLGLDLGGTWLRAELAAPDGRCLGRVRLKAVPWTRLPEVLPLLARRLRLPPLERLTLGATGLWTTGHLTQARRLLRGRAKKISVLSDLELARAAAFAGRPGVIVVAGTGSAAFGVDPSGRRARAGGLGALLGDEGSGFWLGRALLRDEGLSRGLGLDPLAFAHAPRPVRAVAALAPRLLALAARDRRARALREEAAGHLADCARQAASRLRFPGPIPLSWTGSLFDDEAFRRAFLRALKSSQPPFDPAAPLLRPERAAATLAL